MVNDWIHRHKYFLTEYSITTTAKSTVIFTPERLTSTSLKIMELTNSKNLSEIATAVQKSIKNTQTTSPWIDSGT